MEPQIPVRAEVKGVQKWANGTMYNFHHYYEYVDFRTYLPADETIFLVMLYIHIPV
jgi:hypothetical protein